MIWLIPYCLAISMSNSTIFAWYSSFNKIFPKKIINIVNNHIYLKLNKLPLQMLNYLSYTCTNVHSSWTYPGVQWKAYVNTRHSLKNSSYFVICELLKKKCKIGVEWPCMRSWLTGCLAAIILILEVPASNSSRMALQSINH